MTNYAGGAGFASFCFVLAFLLLFGGGIYYAPLLLGGSAIEKRILRNPFDIEKELEASSHVDPAAP